MGACHAALYETPAVEEKDCFCEGQQVEGLYAMCMRAHTHTHLYLCPYEDPQMTIFILHPPDTELKFPMCRYVPRMCTCTYVTGQYSAEPDDPVLFCQSPLY